jgi:hypothetical protein
MNIHPLAEKALNHLHLGDVALASGDQHFGLVT